MEVVNTSGRRKTSVARLYVSAGSGKISVNGKDFAEYFPTEVLQIIVKQPFGISEVDAAGYDLNYNIKGGGISGQAGAARLALSKALCVIDIENRPPLKLEGLLTRDPRMVERKKPGRKKARKKFQFSKR